MELLPIRSALISVYNKDGIDAIATLLHQHHVTIYSTGGTHQYLQQKQIPVTDVSDLTHFPEIFGGRVKTLHPTLFGGILYRRHNDDDLQQAQQHNIPAIDLVIVDLYPFESTLASGASSTQIIEKIDIGGVSLIRAAAKNYYDVTIVAHTSDYATLHQLLSTQQCCTTMAQRHSFAAKAFAITSHYDSAICQWFDSDKNFFKLSMHQGKALRYGENPHQEAKFFGPLHEVFSQLHGKDISYNNLLDIDAALGYIAEFDEPTVAIIKHNNACGLASAPTIATAYQRALAGDPTSAFGGVVVANRLIDSVTATLMHELFMEVLIAPQFSPEALQMLQQKKNRIILLLHQHTRTTTNIRTALNGILTQDSNLALDHTRTVVTTTQPTASQLSDMNFAMKICKHHKSNAIVLARHAQMIGSGSGSTSRIDALQHAIKKAQEFGFDIHGAACASDAFFPFDDCVKIAHQAGITSFIQPGGSLRDNDSTLYCNTHHLPMIHTGMRHFKH